MREKHNKFLRTCLVASTQNPPSTSDVVGATSQVRPRIMEDYAVGMLRPFENQVLALESCSL